MANESKLTTIGQMKTFAQQQDARDDQQDERIRQLEEGSSSSSGERLFDKGVLSGGTGAAYTVTIEGIAALEAGLSFILIPHTVSTVAMPTLNVNGLGAKNIRRRVSNSTITTVTASSTNWLGANKPIRMTYDGSFWIADFTRPNANDIYGTVAIEQGGTGASTAESALTKLGAQKKATVDGETLIL